MVDGPRAAVVVVVFLVEEVALEEGEAVDHGNLIDKDADRSLHNPESYHFCNAKSRPRKSKGIAEQNLCSRTAPLFLTLL